jgi:hypothetical protein
VTVDAPGKPTCAPTADGYSLTWASGIEAQVERIAEHRDELTAELTIHSARAPRPGLLHRARANLMSSQTRRTLATHLEKRDPELDWTAMLEQLCFIVIERYRSGEPAVDLRTWDGPTGTHWLLEPFIDRGGPTILFAAGGTGKSMFALAMAVSVAAGHAIVGTLRGEAGPVLYLDWETDAGTVHERMRAISAGAGIPTLPPVHYRRCIASLSEAAPEIRREILRTKAVLVVVDSFGAARGGEPESADVTIKAMNAGRSLGVPWLAVDHVTKQQGNDSAMPFGSAFTHNLARVTWSMDRNDGDESRQVIALRNRKMNNGRQVPQIGYGVVYEADEEGVLWSVQYHRTDIADSPSLAARLPLRQRILAELARGFQTPQALAELVGADQRVVGARLTELRRAEKVVRNKDGMYGVRSDN